MSEHEKFNTAHAQQAEQARRQRDERLPIGAAQVKVVSDHAITVAGKTHKSGATFVAPEETVRDALARGLVEKVEQRAKR